MTSLRALYAACMLTGCTEAPQLNIVVKYAEGASLTNPSLNRLMINFLTRDLVYTADSTNEQGNPLIEVPPNTPFMVDAALCLRDPPPEGAVIEPLPGETDEAAYCRQDSQLTRRGCTREAILLGRGDEATLTLTLRLPVDAEECPVRP
jgi:hypothetical protein